MKKMTEQNLINAFGGESLAEKENFNNVARLYRAIAQAEYFHALDHYKELKHLDGGFVANSMAAFGPGDTRKNLKLAIDGETFEIEEMYPVYIDTAKFQGEKDAQRTFEWAYGTEKMHKQLYETALYSVNSRNDVKLGPIQVCEVCGYTLEGDAPDKCPLCQATKDKFNVFK